jgi:predicted Fe-Mo cluster-binding NifX family protein
MKIVVPVDTDKSTIIKRTGRAPFYAIYENETAIAYIENQHAKEEEEEEDHRHGHGHEGGAHHHEGEGNHHRKDVANLRGCDVILAQAVGEQMKEALEHAAIKIVKLSKYDGTHANEVVANYLAGTLKSQNK